MQKCRGREKVSAVEFEEMFKRIMELIKLKFPKLVNATDRYLPRCVVSRFGRSPRQKKTSGEDENYKSPRSSGRSSTQNS